MAILPGKIFLYEARVYRVRLSGDKIQVSTGKVRKELEQQLEAAQLNLTRRTLTG